MLAKLRDLFSATPKSPRAKQEMYDLASGLLMSRYRSIRLSEAGLEGATREVTEMQKMYQKAVEQCEEEYGR